jgi:general stress protein YciG
MAISESTRQKLSQAGRKGAEVRKAKGISRETREKLREAGRKGGEARGRQRRGE